MKCLTICQPYAHLIITPADEMPPSAPVKLVENRTWETPYRGPLLIHAGKNRDFLSLSDDGTLELDYHLPAEELVFGAIVGVVELHACVPIAQIRDGDVPFDFAWLPDHAHAFGPICWVLQNPRRFAVPIPYRGAQGLFDVPDEIVAEQLAALSTRAATPEDFYR
ncbi:MAG TPA: ASCH domain-containing protein [Pirellulales bacterium]